MRNWGLSAHQNVLVVLVLPVAARGFGKEDVHDVFRMFLENPAYIHAVQLGMVKSDVQEGSRGCKCHLRAPES